MVSDPPGEMNDPAYPQKCTPKCSNALLTTFEHVADPRLLLREESERLALSSAGFHR